MSWVTEGDTIRLIDEWIEANHPESGLFRVYWKDVIDNKTGGVTFDPEEGEGLRFEWFYENGIQDGVSKGWYPNGNIKQIRNYKDGMLVGKFLCLTPEGHKQEEIYYNNGGKEDGLYIKWQWNRGKVIEGTYKDGKQDGLWTTWFWDGQKKSEIIYKNGERADKWTQWIDIAPRGTPIRKYKKIEKSYEGKGRRPFQPKNVKIYGAGSIGNHLSYACRNKGWGVTVCDIDESALLRMKNDIYPSRYGKWDDEIVLTDNVEVIDDYYDVVIVGTPPEGHIPIALEELESKNPPEVLLIEKPLGTPDLKGCQELWDMSKEKDVLVLCGYNHILTENTEQSAGLIDKGIIGECESLHVQWTEHWGGIFNAHPWIDGPQDCYLGFTDRGGGAMCEHSHAISIWQHFSHLLGCGKIIEVSATITEELDYDETSLLSVKTDKGLEGTILMDVITNPPVKKVKVKGDEGYLEWKVTEKADFIKYSDNTVIFNKTRSDDFVGEINYIHRLLGEVHDRYGTEIVDSLALKSGLDVMMVIAAARLSNDTGMRCIIDQDKRGNYKGYSLDFIKTYGDK
jgi:predicted dehydrogenase/antitoxin component YwqK of YwqJK toxin-antitoxin module